jgi:hypothetical protein
MRRAHVGVTALMLVMAVTSCVTASAGGGTGGSAGDVITAAELEQHQGEDLLALIMRSRPTWLHMRRQPTADQPDTNPMVVVIDGVPQQPGLDPLRVLKVSDLRDVRRLSPSDATMRFGTNMTAGAILVTTKR